MIEQLHVLSTENGPLAKSEANRAQVSMELQKIKSQLESVRIKDATEGRTIFSDRFPVVEPYGKYGSTISPVQNSLFDNPGSLTNN